MEKIGTFQEALKGFKSPATTWGIKNTQQVKVETSECTSQKLKFRL